MIDEKGNLFQRKLYTHFTPRVILSGTPPEIPLRLRLVLLGLAPKVRLCFASLRMTRGGVQSKPKRSAGRLGLQTGRVGSRGIAKCKVLDETIYYGR